MIKQNYIWFSWILLVQIKWRRGRGKSPPSPNKIKEMLNKKNWANICYSTHNHSKTLTDCIMMREIIMYDAIFRYSYYFRLVRKTRSCDLAVNDVWATWNFGFKFIILYIMRWACATRKFGEWSTLVYIIMMCTCLREDFCLM